MSALLLVLALQGAPTVDVEAGWSGDFFPDEWGRIWVTLQNPGADLDGELRVRIVGGFQGTVELKRAVAMPARSKRRLSWDALTTLGATDVVAELLDARGEVVASRTAPIRHRSEKGRRVALLGARVAALDVPELQAVRLKPDLLPDRLAPLLPVDAIVFAEPAPLEPEQEDMLRAWVEQGGVLVWSAGRLPTASGRPLWRDLSPADVSGLENVALAGRTLSMARCRPRPGARPFGGVPGRPAGYVLERGRGAAVLLAASFDEPGFEGLVDPALFRAELFPPLRRAAAPTDPRQLRNWADVTIVHDVSQLRSSLQPADPGPSLPRLAVGAAIAVIYALLVGPASWLVQRRRHFGPGWLVFTGLTAGTLGLLVAWGDLFSPHPVRLDHRVFVDPGGVQGISFLRAGPGDRYRVSGPGSLAAQPRSEYTGGRLVPFPVVHGDEGSFESALPALGAMPFVWSRAAGKNDGALRARWTGADRVAIEIRNLSKGTATGVFLAAESELIPVPDLAPESTLTLALAETRKLSWMDGCGRYVGEVEKDYSGYSLRPTPRGELVRASFSAQIGRVLERTTRIGPRGVDLSPVLDRGGMVLVGRLEGGVETPTVSPSAVSTTWALARTIVEAP
jgi:hypothetical protein